MHPSARVIIAGAGERAPVGQRGAVEQTGTIRLLPSVMRYAVRFAEPMPEYGLRLAVRGGAGSTAPQIEERTARGFTVLFQEHMGGELAWFATEV